MSSSIEKGTWQSKPAPTRLRRRRGRTHAQLRAVLRATGAAAPYDRDDSSHAWSTANASVYRHIELNPVRASMVSQPGHYANLGMIEDPLIPLTRPFSPRTLIQKYVRAAIAPGCTKASVKNSKAFAHISQQERALGSIKFQRSGKGARLSDSAAERRRLLVP